MGNLIKIAVLANLFEFYELSVYGYMSAIIGQLFFDPTHKLLATTKAFSIFAMGYLARPLGALFFGTLSDRIGRGYALKYSIALMAVSTALIGILPTYEQIGFWATGSLLLLRLMQGFSAGGEQTGSGCYIFEAAPLRDRSFLCGAVIASVGIGFLLGSLTQLGLYSVFTHEELLAWAWRIPFWLSVPLAVGVYQFRKSLQSYGAADHQPLRKEHESLFSEFSSIKNQFIQALCLVSFSDACVYTFLIWMPIYLSSFLSFPEQQAQFLNTLALTLSPLFTLLAGYLAYFIDYRKIITFSVLILLFAICPLFPLLPNSGWSVAFMFHLLCAIVIGAVSGVLIEITGELFPTGFRGRGMNLSFALSDGLIGGATPVILNYTVQQTGLLSFPAFYVMTFGLFALLAVWKIRMPKK